MTVQLTSKGPALFSDILTTRLDRGLAWALIVCALIALVVGAYAVHVDAQQPAPRPSVFQVAEANPALQVGGQP